MARLPGTRYWSGAQRAVAKLLKAHAGDREEAVEKLPLILAGLERHAAALRHLPGKGDHLVKRVLSGEAPDERLDGAAQLVVAFTGTAAREGFRASWAP